jgi:hypothetical protein
VTPSLPAKLPAQDVQWEPLIPAIGRANRALAFGSPKQCFERCIDRCALAAHFRKVMGLAAFSNHDFVSAVRAGSSGIE